MTKLTGTKRKAEEEVKKGKKQIAATAAAPTEAPAPKAKAKAWQKWTVADVLKQVLSVVADDVDQDALRVYIEESLDSLKSGASHAIGMAPADYIIGSIENFVNDGGLTSEDGDDDVIHGDDDDDEQPIIEVSQDEVKKALRALSAVQNIIIKDLYDKHEEYNVKFFDGQLALPLITIEKLSNRTLGNYTYGKNNIPIENHIRFNQNFIALQLEDDNQQRIYETLIHEMIHQWQDQVLYAKADKPESEYKKFRIAQRDPEDPADLTQDEIMVTFGEALQKKRPKEWHNRDFKDMAAVVGIPAKGAKCHGNAARMPEPKSFNRKFVCGCIASNGYPVTVYSTRPLNMVCVTCIGEGREGVLIEVPKATFKGKTIEVTTSHVEKIGQDAVMDDMKKVYPHFSRFSTKGEKDDFIERLSKGEMEESPVTEMKDGVYQKGHNAYGLGFRYWVAHSTVIPESNPDDLRKEVEKVSKLKANKPVTPPTPAPPLIPGKGKILKFSKKVEGGTEEVGAAKEAERVYSAENPQDVLDLYKELGSTRKVADKLGMAQSTLSVKAKKMGIDWHAATFNPDWTKQ